MDPRCWHLCWHRSHVRGNLHEHGPVERRTHVINDLSDIPAPDHVYSSDEVEHQWNHRKTFDDDLYQAKKGYKEASDTFVNKFLRDNYREEHGHIGRSPTMSPYVWGRYRGTMYTNIGRMDQVTSHPSLQDMHLFRGYHSTFKGLRKGDEFIDHGYTGLTSKKFIASDYAGSVKIPGMRTSRSILTIARVHVPAGTRGHLLDHPRQAGIHDHEGEFLLQRGTRFRVMGHSVVEGESRIDRFLPYHVTHLRVVGQHPARLADD
jgi:hypothetical protein